ncbi:MAG TPA: hypothetical protein VGX37_00125 [Allosphingosinicella sp.]|nr:hypothetical protein [Allosphingosinicella sp.]
MSWGQNKLALSRAAVAAVLIAGAAAAQANVLVVRSSGPSAASYRPGRSLPDNARIALRPGDTLVLLSSAGTRTFRGPGTFSPAQAVQAQTRTVQGSNGQTARVGAVRSAGILPTSPTTIWQVDVSQGGTMCLASTSDVMLWRPDSSRQTTVTIIGHDGASHDVIWPAGSATAAWPSSMPIADGATYQLRQPGVAVPTQVTFKTLQSVPEDVQGVAEALIRNECEEQLDLLVASTPTL